MNPIKEHGLAGSINAWLVASFGVIGACSSSSSGTNPAHNDAGGEASVFSPLSDSGGTGLNATCGQLAAILGGMAPGCPAGQTCCTSLSIATFSASSMCVAKDQCTGTSNECQTAADCSGGKACCAGAAATDASAEASGVSGDGSAGGTGALGGFDPIALGTTCQTTCEPGQQQLCTTDAECAPGQTCQAAPGAGDAGGGFTAPMTCQAPQPDGGGAGPEGGPSPDASPPVDAGDASADQ